MKKLFLILLILITLKSFAQPFSFSDTTFKKGEFLPLWDIYFELAKPQLMTIAQPQLDSLALFLVQHKTLNIEIGVHTDFRGDDNLNLELAKKRAITIGKYLMNKGIEKDRLILIGFGETKPIIEFEDWKKIMDTHRCAYYGKSNRRITVVIL
jgi:outer membrane protein OmpA-like peptidoglycan-associated protein